MKMSKIITIAAVLAFSAILLAPGLANAIPEGLTDADPGTRAGEVGWQYDTFSQNLNVNVTPETITTMDQIVVTISSEISEVWIRQAAVYGVVYPEDGFQFPISFPFLKKSDTTFQCTIEPYAWLSSYEIEFYIMAYDYFNTPMDSRTSNLYFSYSAMGSGWRHESFDDNIELTYWPLRANATEDVEITLISKDNITMDGANLWVIYETPEGEAKKGGWNFSQANVNSTEMRQTIPGYPAGTNITFWVIAWDQYNAQIVSKFYNYSVIGIVEYTDFPFEYSDAAGSKDVWVPDDVVTLSMAGMCALGIPLFIYLYAITVRRAKRAEDLIVKKTTLVPTNEVPIEEEVSEKPEKEKKRFGRKPKEPKIAKEDVSIDLESSQPAPAELPEGGKVDE